MPAFLAPISALLATVIIMQAGASLSNTLVPLRGDLEGFSTTVIGVMGAAYFGGFVIGCFVCPLAVRRVGHIRTFAAVAAIGAACLTLLPLATHPVVWIGLRMLGGATASSLFMVIESWLNERTDNAHRGQTFSIYQMILFTGSLSGQNMLGLADVAEPDLFAYATVLMVLALVPVAMTTSESPKPLKRVKVDIRWVIGVSPLAVFGCLLVGLANGSVWSLAPVFASSQGFEPHQVGWFMSAMIVGGAASQWPIGKLSDSFDRRRLIVIVAFCSSIMGLVLAFSYGRGMVYVLPAILGYGVVALTLYSMCVAHVNDIADQDRLIEVASGMLLMYGIGAAVGPIAISTAISATSYQTLFFATAAVHCALAVFVIWRLIRKPRARPKERPAFVVTMPRAAPYPSALEPTAAAAKDNGAPNANPGSDR